MKCASDQSQNFETCDMADYDHCKTLEFFHTCAEAGENLYQENQNDELIKLGYIFTSLRSLTRTSSRRINKANELLTSFYPQDPILEALYLMCQDKTSIVPVDMLKKHEDHWLAQFLLGLLYKIEKSTIYDPIEAFQWLHKSAQQGCLIAQFQVALSYGIGRGIEKDMKEYERIMTDLAEKGINVAQEALIKILIKRHDEEKNVHAGNEALRWSKILYQDDKGPGGLWLYNCFKTGHGVKKDMIQAVEYLKESIGVGHCASMIIYFENLKEGKLFKDAIKYLQMYLECVGEQDHFFLKLAQNYMGDCYYFGEGIEKDYNLAFSWYQKAALANQPWGLRGLANCYNFGRGTEKDLNKAFDYYQKAADLGATAAHYDLAFFYKNGLGGQVVDMEKAIFHFSAAAKKPNQNQANAQNQLGWIYSSGNGVPQSDKIALEWFEKSANLGHSGSMNTVGIDYKDGRGVEKNLELGLKWLQKSAKLKNPHAMANLAWYVRRGVGIKRDDIWAFKLYTSSAAENCPEGINGLGSCNYDGVGCAKDYSKAIELWTKAAELGNQNAKENLMKFKRLPRIVTFGLILVPSLAVSWFFLRRYWK